MVILAVLMSLLGIYLLQARGRLTTNLAKRIGAISAFVLCTALLSIEYGILRSIFIFIGLVSMAGTLYTLVQYKLTE